MNKFIKVILAFVLIFSSLIVFNNQKSNAAGKTYSATVNAKSLTVREKASTKSKKMGTLKEGTKVTVYAKTKSGWSEIKYKKKKAYVETKGLKFVSEEVQVSYLKDTNYEYYYSASEPDYEYSFRFEYKLTAKNGYNYWKLYSSQGTAEYFEKETEMGIYEGSYADETYEPKIGKIILEYPIKLGNEWREGETGKGFKYKIIGTNESLTTPAGSFNNVVIVEELRESKSTNVKHYFAPNVGEILTEGKDWKTTLTKIEKK